MATNNTENNLNNTDVNVSEEASHAITIFAEPIVKFDSVFGKIAITNSLITSWIAVLVIIIFALTIRLKLKKIPGKMQSLFEVFIEGALNVCDSVTNNRKITEKVFPIVICLFVFILINNWIGLLPFVSAVGFYDYHEGHKVFVPLFRAGTADLNFTLAMGLLMVLGSNIFGAFIIGIWKMFNKYVNIQALGLIIKKIKKDKSVLVMAPISIFVGILELIGEVAKIASLSFRLFGNVFAGEVLLAAMAGILVYVLPGPFLFLEVFVGLIQALIFSLLTTVYFTIASQDHDSHDEEHQKEHEQNKMVAV
jgi:F-type H+-transporting ATPase subunit a